MRVAWAIGRRVRETRSDDAWIAFATPSRCAIRGALPAKRFRAMAVRAALHHAAPLPLRMGGRHADRTLALPLLIRRLVRRVAEAGLRRVLLHENGRGRSAHPAGFLRACGLRVGGSAARTGRWTTRSPASSTSS